MNRPRTASLAAFALALAALLGAPATSAVAAGHGRSTPALRLAGFEARGTGGWVIGVSASPGRGKHAAGSIGLVAHGPHHEEVDYIGLKATVTPDFRITMKAPGLGRIAVRFERSSETILTNHPRKGCKLEGTSAILKGVFRGTIEFHGERGYTRVARRSARGEVVIIPREVCKQAKHRRPPRHAAGPPIEYLRTGRDLAGGSLEFSAFRLDRSFGGSPPAAEFSATYSRERNGVLTIARTEVEDEAAASFSLTAPAGMPTEATVAPPAPFTGTASFKLESPTTASWTGDLSVELPTLGTVTLAGPGSRAGACAARCTKTFPGDAVHSRAWSGGGHRLRRLPW